ncbi:lambda-crystallin [Aplysia californica]|uniref:Lambda-crystallin n=1 Tax=Aplysia californica TaxID=6500 RepID=A0ABM1AAV6_APLCA|nr:lambda-crystallin [Aplysia californica]
MSEGHIAILSCNAVSLSYATLYISGGHRVVLYGEDAEVSEKVTADIQELLSTYEEKGLLKGSLSRAEQGALVSCSCSLVETVSGAFLVQDCLPDKLETKRKVWQSTDQWVRDDVILVSSATTLMPSQLSEKLAHKNRFVVVNHVDPLYYLRAMEVVPAKWTDPDVVTKTVALLKELGQTPATLKKEIPGFLINRVQSMLMREAYRLVHDGVISADECDTLMTEGIGLRYALMGPWEAVYLDASGMYSLQERYGDMVYKAQLDLKPELPMVGETVDRMQASMERVAGPSSNGAKRMKALESKVAAFAKLKQDFDEEDSKVK